LLTVQRHQTPRELHQLPAYEDINASSSSSSSSSSSLVILIASSAFRDGLFDSKTILSTESSPASDFAAAQTKPASGVRLTHLRSILIAFTIARTEPREL